MAEIIVTKPGEITRRDKATLRKSGVVIIESDFPETVRFIKHDGHEVSGTNLYWAAMDALSKSINGANQFVTNMASIAVDRRTKNNG